MTRTVMVTGAAGFIGSHLVQALLARGDRVRGLDPFDETLYGAPAKRRNVDAIRQGPGGDRFELVEGDLRDAGDVRSALAGCDAVCHLAALAGVRPSVEDPHRYVDVNVGGTLTLLAEMRRAGVTSLVFASSSSVYGATAEPPFREDAPADRPESPYGATKRSGELVCHVEHRLHDIDCSCLRFFTVYGPRQRPDMAIHKFCLLAEAGEPLPLFGDGSTRRDYTFVSDIVDGILRALDRLDGYEVFNLGAGGTTTLLELVETIERVLDREVEVEHLPPRAGDVPVTHADISRAERLLGYAPEVDLEEGIRRFLSWHRDLD